jgi:hypothetical protein
LIQSRKILAFVAGKTLGSKANPKRITRTIVWLAAEMQESDADSPPIRFLDTDS